MGTIKTRIKSKVVWLGVIAQVIVLLSLINTTMADTAKIVLTSICEICTLFGLLNNPNDKNNF